MTMKIVITAAASGIGRAIAEAFLANGDEVYICDINQDALAQFLAANPHLHGEQCDVGDEEQVKRFVTNAAETLGGIDVLVNNAGISGPTTPVADLSTADFQSVLAVNLVGTFMVTREAIPYLEKSDDALILCMSSLGGRFGYPNRSPYAITKRGIIAFVETLALELGDKGIRANAIAPGAVNGDRIRRVIEGRAKAEGISVEQATANALAVQSTKRFVEPAEIGQLAVFLASPAARSVNGQVLAIDGQSRSAS